MAPLQRYKSENLKTSDNYAERWQGPDGGLICAWLAGLQKASVDSQLARKALDGELPVTPFKGGVEKAIKTKTKVGAFHYVAYWQGLRSEDLNIDPQLALQKTCSRTGVLVSFTSDTQTLLAADTTETQP